MTGVQLSTPAPSSTPVCPWCGGSNRVAGELCVACKSRGGTLAMLVGAGLQGHTKHDAKCTQWVRLEPGGKPYAGRGRDVIELSIDHDETRRRVEWRTVLGLLRTPVDPSPERPARFRGVDGLGDSCEVSWSCNGTCNGTCNAANSNATQDATQLQNESAERTRCVDCGIDDDRLRDRLLEAIERGDELPNKGCVNGAQHRFRGEPNAHVRTELQMRQWRPVLAQAHREQLARERGLR